MYRHNQDHGAGADHFQISGAGSSPFSQSQFASPIYGIDPALQASPQHLHPHNIRPSPSRQASQVRQESTDAPGSMQPPRSSVSPRLGTVTPSPGGGPGFIPTDRSPPSKNVTAETITDAFEQFILYCNPNFPLDVDTSTLRSSFQTPPKSDNKDFETYKLFMLIKKFEAKEIKTWAQLALDLGVEAPDTSKGQSVQKVQQYSVRLKRWMRAMHIDAFFDYMNGKQHAYFTEIPHPSDPYPTGGRDGVLTEEDLAIRALDPSFRPKRGRRRNSETEQDDNDEPANKQARLLDSAAPMSAMPFSAHPDNFNDPWAVASAVTPSNFAPWSARPSAPPSAVSGNLRWQMAHNQTPSTPHPASAMSTSMSAHIEAAFDGEPRSAITPRRRRKHGPAVSSAWPSTSVPGAKPRGRPPANRNVQDGPFGTFPVDPSGDRTKPGTLPTPISTTVERPAAIEDPSPRTTTPSTITPGGSRGHRLSLQVPPHTGGPVRLATPPTVLVNGETNETSTKSDSDDPSRNTMAPPPQAPPPTETVTASTTTTTTTQPTKRPAGFSFETLKRVVASDLLRADIINRRNRLTGEEAKKLADAVLDRLNVPRASMSSVRDDLARLTAASWLGVGNQFNVPLGPSAGHGKRINVTRFRTDADGYEEITFSDETEDVREVYDIFWHVSQGGCTGAFEMKGLSLGKLTDAQSLHDTILKRTSEAVTNLNKSGWLEKSMQEVYGAAARASRHRTTAAAAATGDDDGVDWKARYKALEFAGMLAKGEMERAQQRMLEKIMDALL